MDYRARKIWLDSWPHHILAVQPQANHSMSLRQGREWFREKVSTPALTPWIGDFSSEMGMMTAPTSLGCHKD